ncbi:sigma-70 family RNA polymerase sigma factor [Nocardioides zeae]|uniref:Sigma-70 family RNA polymerase sigma factor n=1 Tax=Nocardioides imazamoxiresistens TaxID=3231893 RepID=A0ABU3Q0P2_9ACTN|nr:sigma-70 family RNA polymerase sigma factor [Nocardioides zeae]MDT9595044.1 sigma-70 family RNA polymerase sigma factor [Nocardioides zeae]
MTETVAESLDEAQLLERARGGDETAFAALVTPRRNRLWSVCLRVTGDRHDAEDALQDALTAAWQHLATFRGDARLDTWLYRIASNAALAVARRRRERAYAPDELPEDGDARRDHADQIADTDRVRRALAALPEQFREAVVLRELADLTYEEIAAHQGVGVQTVKSRLNRARAQLVAALAD